MECLEICENYREQLAEHQALQAASSQTLQPPQLPLLMQGLNVATIDDFLLETIKRIRHSDLEEALLILPYTAVCKVLQQLAGLVAECDHIELISKVTIFLLKLHHAPIVANQNLLPALIQLQKLALNKVQDLRVNINLINYHLLYYYYCFLFRI